MEQAPEKQKGKKDERKDRNCDPKKFEEDFERFFSLLSERVTVLKSLLSRGRGGKKAGEEE